MAKTTKQTTADLDALSKVLEQIADKALKVEQAIDKNTSFRTYDALSEKLLALIGTYSELATVQEKVKDGAKLSEVGRVEPMRQSSSFSNQYQPQYYQPEVEEKRINLATFGVGKTNKEIIADAQLTSKRLMDSLEAERAKYTPKQQTNSPASVTPVSALQNAPASPPIIDEEAVMREGAALEKAGGSAKKTAEAIKGLTDQQKAAIAQTDQYAKAMEYAAKVNENFNQASLKRVSQGGLGGKASLDFEYMDKATGSVHQLQLAVDEAGNVFPSVQRKFRDFAQSVVRDVGELAKWTLAIGLIYGPLQKAQEILTLMIDNEAKLADAGVAINSAYANTGQIFDTVAESANKAGESINETVDAFAYSYRAVGSSVSETDRYTAATKLMNDALVLAKLSSLNASQSIDTLSAAIRQTGGDFSSAEHLLDSWVKVTKIANVDMTTLATGVATLGDAAETAGIDTDHLNGIIAVLAENSNLSGQEVANAARALVSGLQSDQAQKALQDVGIATKNANGELRNFLDIIGDIREKTASGLIDATKFADLTLKLGGGSRRQATFSSFITNSGEVDSIAAQSASATGDAQDALARKTATAQTAITRLDNSFQSLAETLGNEGGFLQIFKDMTNTTTLFVDGLDSVASVAGKATPALLALGAAAAYLFTRTDPEATQKLLLGRAQSLISGGLDRGLGSVLNRDLYGVNGGQIGPAPTTQRTFGQQVSNFATGSGFGSTLFQGAAIAALPAIYNATSGEKFGGEKAGADIVGGILGSFVGGPAGSIIGTAIAEGFVRATTSDTKLENYFKGITITPKDQAGAVPTTKEAAEKLLFENQNIQFGAKAKDILGGVGGEFFGNMTATLSTAMTNAILGIRNKLPGAKEDVGPLTVEQTALLNTSPDIAKLFQQYLDTTKAAGGVTGQDSAFQQRLNKTGLESLGGTTTNSYLDSIVKSRLEELDAQRVSGKLKPTDYQTQANSVSGAKSVEESYFTGFGKEFMDAAKIKSSTEAYKGLLDVLTNGGEDSKNTLNQLLASITDIINKGKEATPEDLANLAQYKKQAGIAAADALTESRISGIKPPQIIGDVNAPRTSSQSALVEQRTKELEKQYYSSKEGGSLSESDMNAYLKKNFEEAAEPIKDATTLFYKMLESFDPRFRSAAEDQLKKEGKLPDASNKGLGFQEFKDVDRGTLESLAAKSVMINKQWSKPTSEGGFNYGGQVDDTIAIAKDGVAKPIHADMKILAMLLEKLVDQGQKQLDGMYNIPEGATFWVPLTAAYYRNGGGGGGGSTSDTSSVDTSFDVSKNRRESDWNPDNIHNTPPTGQIGSYAENMHSGQSIAQDWLNMQSELQMKQIEKLKAMASGPAMSTGQSNAADWLNKYGSDSDSRGFGGKKGLYSPANDVVNPQAISTKLNINIQAQTQVLLDGRVIADIIKTYLTSDLVNVGSGSGATTKDYLL